jgi:hypothetical protein
MHSIYHLHHLTISVSRWSWRIGAGAGRGKRSSGSVSPDGLQELDTPVIETGMRENAPAGTPKTGKYALRWGAAKFD